MWEANYINSRDLVQNGHGPQSEVPDQRVSRQSVYMAVFS